jgi:DNA-binding LacI/PurR family transcriptional regulator
MKSQNNTELLDYKPKHVIISDIFREKIAKGKFRKGDKLLPDEEIARKYNVNKRTVAVGLNSLVKEGLLERAPRRGTIVVKDDSQGNKTSNAVGMVMLSKGDVYNKISHDITRGFTNLNLYPILINDQVCLQDSSVKSFMQAIVNDQVVPYGFMIDGNMEFPFEFLKQNINKFHNIVFINKYHYPEKIAQAKYVLVDFAEAGRLAARHFIAQGHKQLACLAMNEPNYAGSWSSVQVMIMQGFAEACRESNVQFNEEVFWKLLHGAPLSETINTLLSGSDHPDAIFAYQDSFIRHDLLPLLKNTKEIELIGFYNTHHAEECGFSSICIHEETIAENAIKLLTHKTTEKEILIKPELIIRNQ